MDRCLFGARIKACRLAAGMTLREVGEKMGVSIPYLFHVEGGGRTLSAARYGELAVALGVDEDTVLDWAGACKGCRGTGEAA